MKEPLPDTPRSPAPATLAVPPAVPVAEAKPTDKPVEIKPGWPWLVISRVGQLVVWFTGVAAALAAVVGYNYHLGLIDGFGLPPGQFPISLQDAILLSHEAFVREMAEGFWITLIKDWHVFLKEAAFVGLLTFVLIYLGAAQWLEPYRVKAGIQTKKFVLRPMIFTSLASVFMTLVTYLVPRVVFGTMLLIFLAPYTDRGIAVKEAERMKALPKCDDAATAKGCVSIRAVDSRDRELADPFVGRVVMSNERWTAVIRDGAIKVYRSDDLRVTIPLKQT